eukprot:TRINITY_DN19134_c0_g1_i1.p1 TRINITY_DN19134_c0_g1~~TRINITY_DN19134_c0_g1_i1.p1  ORF type:complete len:350 (+),score=131.11 TRINITY_DN19134_c0_g1_i1:76-1050(+)
MGADEAESPDELPANQALDDPLYIAQYDAASVAFDRLVRELRLPFLERLLYHKFFISKRDQEHLDATLQIVNALEEHKRRTLRLLKLVYEREFAQTALKVLCYDYAAGQLSTLEVQTRVLQLLYTLQQATLKVVEGIAEWRQPLTRPYPFMWKGINYISKIVADSHFLDSCELSRVLPMAVAQHPLCSNLNSLSLFSGGSARPGSATFPLKRRYVGTTPPETQARLQRAEAAVYDEQTVQEQLLRELNAISASGAFVPLLNLSTLIPNCITGVKLTNDKWIQRYAHAVGAAEKSNEQSWTQARTARTAASQKSPTRGAVIPTAP